MEPITTVSILQLSLQRPCMTIIALEQKLNTALHVCGIFFCCNVLHNRNCYFIF